MALGQHLAATLLVVPVAELVIVRPRWQAGISLLNKARMGRIRTGTRPCIGMVMRKVNVLKSASALAFGGLQVVCEG